MLRSVVICSFLLGACDVGAIPGIGPDGNNPMPDMSGSGSGDVCVDAVTPAAAKHTHAASGNSRRGEACQSAGCHLNGNTGTGAPAFSFSGTISTASDGATPKPGATIKLIFGSTTIASVSDEDGNFYSTQTITPPGRTFATSCPTLTPMVGKITSNGDANCNNCHKTGGTTTPMNLQ